MDAAAWIASYGYPLLFLGVVFEGETFLLAAAIFARNGSLDPVTVMAVATAGALSGDFLFFFIGKTHGAALVNRHPRLKARSDRLTPWLDRFRIPLILGFRFWYGMRAVVPLAFGISRHPTLSFLALNTVGGAAWAVSMTALGYGLGTLAAGRLMKAKNIAVILVAAAVVTVVVIWVRRRRAGAEK